MKINFTPILIISLISIIVLFGCDSNNEAELPVGIGMKIINEENNAKDNPTESTQKESNIKLEDKDIEISQPRTIENDSLNNQLNEEENQSNAINVTIPDEAFNCEKDKDCKIYNIPGDNCTDLSEGIITINSNFEEEINNYYIKKGKVVNCTRIHFGGKTTRARCIDNECQNWGRTEINDTLIQSFIDSGNYSNLKEIFVYLEIPEKDIVIFQITTISPNPNNNLGRVLSGFTGIKNQVKIGWIADNFGSGYISGPRTYQYDETDKFLYSSEFVDMLEDALDNDIKTYYGGDNLYRNYLNIIAININTPEEVIIDLVESLERYISPTLAHALLRNDNVKENKELLKIIANLSPEAYEGYIKPTAEELLEELEK